MENKQMIYKSNMIVSKTNDKKLNLDLLKDLVSLLNQKYQSQSNKIRKKQRWKQSNVKKKLIKDYMDKIKSTLGENGYSKHELRHVSSLLEDNVTVKNGSKEGHFVYIEIFHRTKLNKKELHAFKSRFLKNKEWTVEDIEQWSLAPHTKSIELLLGFLSKLHTKEIKLSVFLKKVFKKDKKLRELLQELKVRKPEIIKFYNRVFGKVPNWEFFNLSNVLERQFENIFFGDSTLKEIQSNIFLSIRSLLIKRVYPKYKEANCPKRYRYH